MSNLRLLGLIVGIGGLLATFLVYRGPKWNRTNFILASFFNLCLVLVSLDPEVVNFIRDALSLQAHQRGRIIALLIISNIFLVFFSFYSRSKIETLRLQFDKLVRKLGAAELSSMSDVQERIKPIMVVIPAYNEAENLKGLLPRMPREIDGRPVGVLVVDDGSTDGTAEVARSCGCLVVSNPVNRGQGAASRLGYDILTKNRVSVGVTMDADNQHAPEDIERLVRPILDGHQDLVIGSRVLGTREKGSRVRNLGILFFSWIVSLLAGLRITDCSSGFKAFNIAKLEKLNLTEDQFQSAEVLIEARKKGLRIGEVPIHISHRKFGRSKKGKEWSYGLHFARTILKAWWRQ
jgi:cellulose synthase/poly-beta-1,6-N-acetylglucosamine synthase-like glycosyltransferase